jgi:hypothetical protein
MKRRIYNIVGLFSQIYKFVSYSALDIFRIDAVLFQFIAEHAFGDVEVFSGFALLTAALFQSIDDKLPLGIFNNLCPLTS